mmetsp:Transcript_22313/g.40256  ORF Transcript_22313/g.40256 Transcript_22313/m.40256 type:complete len:263 (-) Transcript_22313:79-867(-)
MTVDFTGQPLFDFRKLSALHLFVEIWNILTAVVGKLGGCGRSNEIGGEITNGQTRPMHILQTPVRIIGDIDVQQFLHTVLPTLRDIRHVQSTFHHVTLQLVSQNDVKGIGKFVRFHPNETGRDRVDSTIHFFGSKRKLIPKCFLEQGRSIVPERSTKTHMSFPKEGLRLVRTHGQEFINFQSRRTQILFIHGMATLMNGAGQSLIPFLVRKPTCNPDICRPKRGGKRVDTHINSTMFFVKSQCRDNVAIQLHLCINRKRLSR